MGGWGQKMTIFANFQYYLCWCFSQVFMVKLQSLSSIFRNAFFVIKFCQNRYSNKLNFYNISLCLHILLICEFHNMHTAGMKIKKANYVQQDSPINRSPRNWDWQLTDLQSSESQISNPATSTVASRRRARGARSALCKGQQPFMNLFWSLWTRDHPSRIASKSPTPPPYPHLTKKNLTAKPRKINSNWTRNYFFFDLSLKVVRVCYGLLKFG